MTQVIIDDIIPRTQLVAAAGQTVFNTNWTADASSDVLVYARAAAIPANDVTQLVSSSNYNVTFVGGSQTVRVTFLVGRTLDDIVTIVRNTPAERTNLYINTNFVPSMLNQDFGILTLVDQQAQMYDYVVNPGYNVSATIENIVDTVLPILEANQIWAMNPTRTAIIGYDVPSGGSIAPGDAKYLLQQAHAELPNAQAMGALASGLVVNTVTTGVQLTRILTGVTNQTVITNGSGISGNPTVGIATNPIIPGLESMIPPKGTNAQRPVSPVAGQTRYNTELDSLEFYDGTQWVQPLAAVFPLPVENGGTGVDTFTAYAPIVGGTTPTGPLQQSTTGISTIGAPLISQGASALPIFSTSPYLTTAKDVNDNTVVSFIGQSSAVNYLTVANSATGVGVQVSATGSDTNINLTLNSQGTGAVVARSRATSSQFFMVTGTALDRVSFLNMGATAGSYIYTFPDASGTIALTSAPTTWTPTATFATPGDLSVAYTSRTGSYSKVGNLVTVNWSLYFTPTYTTASGNFQITGIPFSIYDTGYGSCLNFTGTVVYPATTTYLTTVANGNSSILTIYATGSASGGITLSTSHLTSGVLYLLTGTVTYLTP